MLKTTKLLATGLCALLALSVLMADQQGKKSIVNAANPESPVNYAVPSLPKELSFCGEAVPLEDRSISERFERELLYNYYQPHQVLYIIKLSRRYFPLIEERLRANGVPEDLKYLCVAESNLQNAISKVGATGFWQFMKVTAPGYGLEVNAEVDERYHVAKSTNAACKYLKAAYKKFGSWTAAAASYNCGMGGYSGRSTFQQTTDYYNLALPDETSKYVFRILTFKYFMENAASLGFKVAEEEGYHPVRYKKITVNTGVANFAEFAKKQGINYKILVEHNPWIRSKKLTNAAKKNYEILIPE